MICGSCRCLGVPRWLSARSSCCSSFSSFSWSPYYRGLSAGPGERRRRCIVHVSCMSPGGGTNVVRRRDARGRESPRRQLSRDGGPRSERSLASCLHAGCSEGVREIESRDIIDISSMPIRLNRSGSSTKTIHSYTVHVVSFMSLLAPRSFVRSFDALSSRLDPPRPGPSRVCVRLRGYGCRSCL